MERKENQKAKDKSKLSDMDGIEIVKSEFLGNRNLSNETTKIKIDFTVDY